MGRTCSKQTPFKKYQNLIGYALWLKDPQYVSSNSLIVISPNRDSIISVKRTTFRQDLCPLSRGVWLYKCMSTSSPSEHFLLKCFTLAHPFTSTLCSYFSKALEWTRKNWDHPTVFISLNSLFCSMPNSLQVQEGIKHTPREKRTIQSPVCSYYSVIL